jgi:DNA (cytosine-5)-methyltransferase 1
MIRSGFHCLAAVDTDPLAIATLRTNLPHEGFARKVDQILEKDLTKYRPEQLSRLIRRSHVDVIVGGPPCQGFSTARQVDGANHGERLTKDRRRYLYKKFLVFVDYFQPYVFVMENVLGLRSAAGGDYFTRVQHEARNLGRPLGRPGYRVHSQVEDARELGVPQKRKRQLIIGVRADLEDYFISELTKPDRAPSHPHLGLAIGDLPILRAGGGIDEREYNLARRAAQLKRYGTAGKQYLFDVVEAQVAKSLTNHVARPHSKRDLRDFARLREGEHAAAAIRKRGVRFEFPYSKATFKDRYTRQSRKNPCSTIVAHLSKDGLMFIHPTQTRSLTPREAARVQTFPDWFRFPSSRTAAFRLIGNAVPPLVGEAVGLSVEKFLRLQKKSKKPRLDASHGQSQKGNVIGTAGIPFSESFRKKMVNDVLRLSKLSARKLRFLSKEEFLLGWYALLLLFPDLHPENALDHGVKTQRRRQFDFSAPDLPREFQRRFTRSGWPVALKAIGQEVWRRCRTGGLTKEEIYRAGTASELGRSVGEVMA